MWVSSKSVHCRVGCPNGLVTFTSRYFDSRGNPLNVTLPRTLIKMTGDLDKEVGLPPELKDGYPSF
ncbi:hypothetical protein DIPPA_31847 [Diplonema papillatum]|nr:hypothetical protein DIPPA_31847 [Diplonema papillatum]